MFDKLDQSHQSGDGSLIETNQGQSGDGSLIDNSSTYYQSGDGSVIDG